MVKKTVEAWAVMDNVGILSCPGYPILEIYKRRDEAWRSMKFIEKECARRKCVMRIVRVAITLDDKKVRSKQTIKNC